MICMCEIEAGEELRRLPCACRHVFHRAGIDREVKKIADESYERALAHIRDNREAVDRITEELIEIETMSGERFREILSEYVDIPEVNIPKEAEELAAAISM